MMRYRYTSCWRSEDGQRFRLAGIIAANDQVIGGYFPNDPDEQREWDCLAEEWSDERRGCTRWEFLQELAERGNGITEEYDTVRQIDAPTLRDALERAFNAALDTHGASLDLYEPIPVATIEMA